MTLPAALQDLIQQQEALEAQRTRILIMLEAGDNSAKFQEQALMCLQQTLAHQMFIAKELLAACAELTCEFVQWPHEIRA